MQVRVYLAVISYKCSALAVAIYFEPYYLSVLSRALFTDNLSRNSCIGSKVSKSTLNSTLLAQRTWLEIMVHSGIFRL